MHCWASKSQVSMATVVCLHNGARAEFSSCLAGPNVHGLCAMQGFAWEAASKVSLTCRLASWQGWQTKLTLS